MAPRPVNILFVCTANVCRSPLAAGLLAFHAAKLGVGVNVASASLDDEIRQVHPTTARMLSDRGVSLGRSASRPLTEAIVDGADLVLVMTADHAKGLVGRYPQARAKTFLLEHLTSELRAVEAQNVDDWLANQYQVPRDYASGDRWDIQDPYHQDDAVYVEVEAQIDRATGWLATVLSTIDA